MVNILLEKQKLLKIILLLLTLWFPLPDDYTEYKDVEQVKRININNRPFTSQLKIIKVDKETGKTVTLNGASFKIKDAQGNYVTQKVSGKKYDTFTTNSKKCCYYKRY